MKTREMNFGEALEALKNGELICREGWNGKGMHIYLEDGYTFSRGNPTSREYEPVVVLFTPQGKHQPGWVCSQQDMLAKDWQLIISK